MDAPDRDPARVGEGGDDEDAVWHRAAELLEGRRDDVGLERVVAAQGAVSAAHEGDAALEALGGREGGRDDLAVARGGRLCVEAARVREHVDRVAALLERPDEVVLLPAGEDGEVGDGLRSRRVVVQHDEGHSGLADPVGDLRGVDAHWGGVLLEQSGFIHQSTPL